MISTRNFAKGLAKFFTMHPDRPLATINRIVSRSSIPNADSIEAVRIKGWMCVGKKGERRRSLCLLLDWLRLPGKL